MSRFLEFPVSGTVDTVPERARRAFRKAGRIRSFDKEAGIKGQIRADSHRAEVTVLWRSAPSEGQVMMEVRAVTDGFSNRSADSALYAFVRAYRDTDWPDPVADAAAARRRLIRACVASVISIGAVAAWLLLR